MIFFRRPTDVWLHEQLAGGGPPFTRSDAIPDPAPRGFLRNAGSRLVGHGRECFEEAARRVREWDFGPGDWCRFIADGPAREGQPVGVLARCLGMHVFNVCEVVGVREFDSADWRSLCVSYATRPGHDMAGAEAFRVSWDRTTDAVSVTIESYSRPASLIGWLAAPYIRSVQRRFVAETLTALEADLYRTPAVVAA